MFGQIQIDAQVCSASGLVPAGIDVRSRRSAIGLLLGQLAIDSRPAG